MKEKILPKTTYQLTYEEQKLLDAYYSGEYLEWTDTKGGLLDALMKLLMILGLL